MATLVDAHTVEVNGTRYHAKKILLATGSWPTKPEFPGNELAITSNEIFDLDAFPQRLLVVGGGYIATEFACIFNGLGAQVTQLYRGDLFMRGFDNDIRVFAAGEIRKTGVDLRFNSNIVSLARTSEGLEAHLTDGSSIVVDAVLCATGRHPNIEGLGLEKTAVTLDARGYVTADERFQTDEPSIFALGDMTGGPQLTPVAIEQAMAFAQTQFGDAEKVMDYAFIPTAVFCQPNIGTVGLTEIEALKDHAGDLDIYESQFKPMKHTISGRDERTLLKLIACRSTDRVLGIHMVGPDAGEIVQGLAVALVAGATKAQFDATVGIHPTAAEEFVTLRSVSRQA